MGVSPSVVALNEAVPPSQMVVFVLNGVIADTRLTVMVAGLEVTFALTASVITTLYCVPFGLVALPTW